MKMKILHKIFLALLLVVSPCNGQNMSGNYVFYTGPDKSTPYQIALDLQRSCPSLRITVQPSESMIANINKLVQPASTSRAYRFTLVQKDVLNSILGPDNQVVAIVNTISPMYDEDISVLVSKFSKINTLNDLTDKKVAVDVLGSGTWITAQSLRYQLGVNWRAIERPYNESIIDLLTGEIDALIIVGGRPVKTLSELGPKTAGYIKFLSFKGVETKLYSTTIIPANTYSWQKNYVETRGTQSVLVSANDVPPFAIKDLLNCIVDKKMELQQWGHPRWQDIQFDNLRVAK